MTKPNPRDLTTTKIEVYRIQNVQIQTDPEFIRIRRHWTTKTISSISYTPTDD